MQYLKFDVAIEESNVLLASSGDLILFLICSDHNKVRRFMLPYRKVPASAERGISSARGVDVIGRDIRMYGTGVIMPSHLGEYASWAVLGGIDQFRRHMTKSGMDLFAGRSH